MTKYTLTAFAVALLLISGCKQEQPPKKLKLSNGTKPTNPSAMQGLPSANPVLAN